MRALRLLNLISLVLVLVTGSVAMASARHQMRGAGAVVICTGYGLTTITVNAEGNRIPGQVILCPDCMPALAALTDTALPLGSRPGVLTPIVYAPIDREMPAPDAPVHHPSRAPPALA